MSDGEITFEELERERDQQKTLFDNEYSEWEQSFSHEELHNLKNQAKGLSRKKKLWGFITAVICLIIPVLVFYTVYGESPFSDKYTDETSEEDDPLSESEEAAIGYVGCGMCCLPIIGVSLILKKLGQDPFNVKRVELAEKYPRADLSNDELMSEIEDASAPDSSSIDYSSADMALCPRCESIMYAQGGGKRAAKALGRGFAKYARWEAGLMGKGSIVGSSGGVFDSMTEDAKYICSECGYRE